MAYWKVKTDLDLPRLKSTHSLSTNPTEHKLTMDLEFLYAVEHLPSV